MLLLLLSNGLVVLNKSEEACVDATWCDFNKGFVRLELVSLLLLAKDVKEESPPVKDGLASSDDDDDDDNDGVNKFDRSDKVLFFNRSGFDPTSILSNMIRYAGKKFYFEFLFLLQLKMEFFY